MITFTSPQLTSSTWWPHSGVLRRQTYGTLTPTYINRYITDLQEFTAPKPRETQFLTALIAEWNPLMKALIPAYTTALLDIGYTQLPPDPSAPTTLRFRHPNGNGKSIFLSPRAEFTIGHIPSTAICAENRLEITLIILKTAVKNSNLAKESLSPKTPTAHLTLADLNI